MSGMKKPLLIPLIVVSLLFIATGSFAAWAFTGRQDYKDNVDKKVSVAVTKAQAETAAQKDKEFADAEKLPFRTYTGPSPYGSLRVKYPKTWSAYVSEKAGGSIPVDGYFQPSFVPGTDENQAVYALRVQISNRAYTDTVQSFQSFIKAGKLKATPYIPVNASSVTGLRLDGQITSNVTSGSMVVLPLRDKTLEVWTESPDFVKDFDQNILPNFSFSQ